MGVLERAAHALTALLRVHPRRANAAAQGKNLRSVLERFASGSIATCIGQEASPRALESLRARVSEALAELDRSSVTGGGGDRSSCEPWFFGCTQRKSTPQSQQELY